MKLSRKTLMILVLLLSSFLIISSVSATDVLDREVSTADVSTGDVSTVDVSTVDVLSGADTDLNGITDSIDENSNLDDVYIDNDLDELGTDENVNIEKNTLNDDLDSNVESTNQNNINGQNSPNKGNLGAISLQEENVIYVEHTGNDYQDILNAIAIANPGDIIDLGDYTYQLGRSQIDLNKTLTLRGNGISTIINGTGGTASSGCLISIEIDGRGSKITGIILNNSQAKLDYTNRDTLNGWAIDLYNSRNILIENCSFLNFNRAINIEYCINTTVINSYFTGVATKITNGVSKEYGSKVIAIAESTNTLIDGNTFEGPVLESVTIDLSTNTTIINNEFINNAYSIYVDSYFCQDSLIVNNTFRNCGHFYVSVNGTEYSFPTLPIIRKLYDGPIVLDGNKFISANDTLILLADTGSDESYIGVKNNIVTPLDSTVNLSSITFVQALNVTENLEDMGIIEILSNQVPDDIETLVMVDYIWYGKDGDIRMPIEGNSTIIMNFENVFTDEPINISFYVEYKYRPINASMTVKINKIDYNVTIENGLGNLLIDDPFEPGNYSIIATLDPSDDYDVASAYGVITVFSRKNFKAIQAMIDEARPGSTIILDGLYEGSGEEIVVNKSINIIGSYTGQTILDANKLSRVFSITANDVYIKNIIFRNVNKAAFGGAIFVDFDTNNLTVSNCTFVNNTANAGAAIAWIGDNGTLENCNFINNFANSGSGGAVNWNGENGIIKDCYFYANLGSSGGAIRWNGRLGNVINSTFINNKAIDFDGGAISWNGLNGTVKDSNFTNNYAFFYGGAVEWASHYGFIDNCYFGNNNVTQQEECGAGAVYWLGRVGTISNSIFEDNIVKFNFSSIEVYAGALAWFGENGTLFNSSFNHNQIIKDEGSENIYGGAVFWNGTNGKVSYCNFTSNIVDDENGGALFWQAESGILSDSYFYNNVASEGGALYWNGSGGTVLNTVFVENEGFEGSAVFWNEENGTIFNSSFINNTATYGTISWDGNYGILNSSIFINNSAREGTGIYWYGNNGTVVNSIFDNNLSFVVAAFGLRSPVIENNFWGINYNTSEEIIRGNIITKSRKAIAPEYWLWLKITGLEIIHETGIYDYDMNFVVFGDYIDPTDSINQGFPISHDSILSNLHDYSVTVNNSNELNQLDCGESVISKNLLKIRYAANSNCDDTLFVYNENGYLITYKNIQVDIPSKETFINADIDLFMVNESATIVFTVTDEDGNLLEGGNISVYIDNALLETVNVEDGKGYWNIIFENPGSYSLMANYSYEDSFYLNSTFSSDILVYGEGNVIVKHTGNDALDIQTAIDNANPGDTIQLGTYDYTDVSDINITKDISIHGDAASITSSGSHVTIFNIVPFSENGPSKVEISGVEFILSNDNVVVLMKAENGSNPLAIDVAELDFVENTISLMDETVVPESTIMLQLESERAVLNPSNDINVNNNVLTAGVKPFEFAIIGITDGSNTLIPSGGNIGEKLATVIEYSDMVTTAVDTDTDGRVGEYFKVVLKDSQGNILSGKAVQIGFNGKIYNRTTDENGSCQLQINLVRSDIYTFAVSFLGDEEYNGTFVVAKITVNAQKGSLTVPNRSYSASAKTKSLSATFKAASGKVVANKKISFTVNGKTYSATTNANGVATVNVSLNTKGTYSFTAKYAGDGTYAAISQSAKLTIK